MSQGFQVYSKEQKAIYFQGSEVECIKWLEDIKDKKDYKVLMNPYGSNDFR